MQKLNTLQSDLRFGNKTVTVEELQQYVKAHGRSKTDLVNYDTSMVNYNPSRSGQGRGGPVFFESNWTRSLVQTSEVGKWLKQVETTMKDRGQPLIPAMQPITATVMHNDEKKSVVVFRSHWGIHAYDMKAGKRLWETPSTWSMDRMVRDTKKVGAINQFVAAQMATRPNMLVENSTVGTLSTDGAFVFMIEDLEVPPGNQLQHDSSATSAVSRRAFGSEEVTNAVNSSKLQAFNLATGKLVWEIGGPTKKDEKVELAESYFLGAPLPLGGKLYVLTEKQQDLRLACIDPLTGKLLNVQTLATARDKMMMDVWRRVQATHLAYGEGILVCPTNAGAILGVDLLSNSLVWAYPYRDKNDGDGTPTWIEMDPAAAAAAFQRPAGTGLYRGRTAVGTTRILTPSGRSARQ